MAQLSRSVPARTVPALNADWRWRSREAFTQTACNRAGILQGAQFDASHRDKPWRSWRFACPTPTVNTETGEVVGWHLPDCGHRDIVVCETDSVI